MKIVHLADLHLGFREYSKINKFSANIREFDVLQAFNEAMNKIAEINPDLIIMAGDLFHKPRPSNFTISNTIFILNKFRQKCNAKIIMIAGNHETVKTTETGSVLKILEFSVPNIVLVEDDAKEINDDKLNVNILCVPHSALANIKKLNFTPDKNYKYNIMTIHGTYENCPEIAGYTDGHNITKDDLNTQKWDYIAFGHYHKFSKLAENAYYSGAIERTTTNIWQEQEDKGFIEYNLADKKLIFHKLSNIRKVHDIKRFNAKGKTSEEINEAIFSAVEKIGNIDDSIIRFSISNADTKALREINYKQIREIRKKALHFKLNIVKDKKDKLIKEEEKKVFKQKQSIEEVIKIGLESFEISTGLNKEKFAELAKTYIQEEALK
ncbi:MAG: metallophosphoesterase [bacterium]